SVGTVDKGDKDLQLRVSGEYESVEDIKNNVLMKEEGATLHDDDVAAVKDTFKNSDSETLVNGEPSIVLSIMKKTDNNTVEVADNIRAAIDDLEGDLVDGAHLDVVIDTSEFVQMSIDSVISNILIGSHLRLYFTLVFKEHQGNTCYWTINPN